MRDIWSLLKTVCGALIIVFLIQQFVAEMYIVQGVSMQSTLHEKDRLVVEKVTDVHRFDVIVFQANKDERYVKRVIGLPGDTITVDRNKLYVNGKYVEERYVDEKNRPFTGNFTLEELMGVKTVPKGYLFVLGDNRLRSKDSRDEEVGFVKMSAVQGKVAVRVWPLKDIGLVGAK